jgi:hypothetical protein
MQSPDRRTSQEPAPLREMCFSNGWLLPGPRPVDVLAFTQVASLISSQGWKHELCFGTTKYDAVFTDLPIQIADRREFYIHPVGLITKEGKLIVEDYVTGSFIFFADWIKLVTKSGAVFLYKTPHVGVDQFKTRCRQLLRQKEIVVEKVEPVPVEPSIVKPDMYQELNDNDRMLPAETADLINRKSHKRLNSVVNTDAVPDRWPVMKTIVIKVTKKKLQPEATEKLTDIKKVRKIYERSKQTTKTLFGEKWLTILETKTPEELIIMLGMCSPDERKALIARYNLDGVTHAIIPLVQAARNAGFTNEDYSRHLYRAIHRIENGNSYNPEEIARHNPEEKFSNEFDISLFSWEEFRIFTRSAGIPDDYALVFYERFIPNQHKILPTEDEIAKKYGITKTLVGNILRYIRTHANDCIQEHNLTKETLSVFLRDHADIEEPMVIHQDIHTGERTIPESILQFDALDPLKKKQILRQLPVNIKWVLVERYNLTHRGARGVYEVSYADIEQRCPWNRRKLIFAMTNGLPLLAEALLGTPPPDQSHKPNAYITLANNLFVDDMTREQFTRLCIDSGIRTDVIEMYIYRIDLGGDNPRMKSLPETAKKFNVRESDVSEWMKSAKEKLNTRIRRFNITSWS